LNIYEGYLFRVGIITEWYHTTNVLSFTQSEEDKVTLRVATSDPEGRVIFVDIGSFVGDRQFSMRATVEGDDASKRLTTACVYFANNHVYFSSNRVHMGFYMQKEEGFYGFGERFVNTFFILVITSSLGLITAIREVIGLGHGVRTAHLD